MTGRRRVQDGSSCLMGMEKIKNGRDQPARVKGDGFTRFEIDPGPRFLMDPLDQSDKQVDIVIRLRDVMSSSQVDPGEILWRGA